MFSKNLPSRLALPVVCGIVAAVLWMPLAYAQGCAQKGAACGGGAACCAGMTCDQDGGEGLQNTCRTCGAGGGAGGEACNGDADCCPGLECLDGPNVCGGGGEDENCKPKGVACAFAGECCPGTICNSGVCRACSTQVNGGGVGSFCGANTDCCPDLMCAACKGGSICGLDMDVCNLPEMPDQEQATIRLIEPLWGVPGVATTIPILPGWGTFLYYLLYSFGWILEVAVGIVIVWMLIGGFQYMISGNNQTARSEAVSRITWAVMGLLLLLFSGLILRTLNPLFFVP